VLPDGPNTQQLHSPSSAALNPSAPSFFLESTQGPPSGAHTGQQGGVLSSPTDPHFLSSSIPLSRGGSFSGSFHQRPAGSSGGGRGHSHHRSSPALRGSTSAACAPQTLGGGVGNGSFSSYGQPPYRPSAAAPPLTGSPMLNGSFSSKVPGTPLRLDSPNAHPLPRSNSGVSSRAGSISINGSTPGSALTDVSMSHGYSLPTAVACSHTSSANVAPFQSNTAPLPSYIPQAFGSFGGASGGCASPPPPPPSITLRDVDPLSRSDRDRLMETSLNRSDMLSGSFSHTSIGPIHAGAMSTESTHLLSAPVADVHGATGHYGMPSTMDADASCGLRSPPVMSHSSTIHHPLHPGAASTSASMTTGLGDFTTLGGPTAASPHVHTQQQSQQRSSVQLHSHSLGGNSRTRRQQLPTSPSAAMMMPPAITSPTSLPTHMMSGSLGGQQQQTTHASPHHPATSAGMAPTSYSSSATEDRESLVSGSSSSSIRDDLPLCENDQGCTLINDKRHQRQFAHTCRLVPCFHAHVKRHAKLFRHAPGQMIGTVAPEVTLPPGIAMASTTSAGSRGQQGGSRSGKQSQRATLALASVNFSHISPDAPNAIPVTVTAKDKCYEIFGDWTQVKLHTFKRYLHQCFKVLPVNQKLFLEGAPMDDDLRSVSAYGVVSRSVIVLREADDEDDDDDHLPSSSMSTITLEVQRNSLDL